MMRQRGEATMVRGLTKCLLGAALAVAVVMPARRAPAANGGGKEPPLAPVKALVADELNQLERELAGRMMRRADLAGDRKARNELDIDLRVIQRALVGLAAEEPFGTNEQAATWLRAKQFRDALKGMEDALNQDPAGGQKEAMAQLHDLSFKVGDLKAGPALDDLCRSAAVAMANVVSTTPVTAASLARMRPAPTTTGPAPEQQRDHPPTVAELTEDVQRLAAISVPLRQQLLVLASGAGAAANANNKEEAKVLYDILAQSVALAKGLQSNTAVGPEQRAAIENQLTEGIVLYADPRTRSLGRNRIEALGQYRQTLTRIGRMGLTTEQMNQFGPAFAWAQSNPEMGAKLMSNLEQFLDTSAKWDATMAKDVSVPAPLRRALDDLKAQFVKARAQFLQDAGKIGGVGAGVPLLDQGLDELKRLYAVASDVQSMGHSFDVLNAYKVKPVGALEKKVTTAALAAAAPTPSTNRVDAQKYLDAVHTLARLSDQLGARPLSELPSPVVQAWAGTAAGQFENRWRQIVAEQAGALAGGALELEKAKIARLETALALGEALRSAVQLETALTRTPLLARWVDWSIDPAALNVVLAPYREITSQAVFGYASDNLDGVERWQRAQTRYQPLVALIVRNATAYADACEKLPIGHAAEISRLGTPLENAPFATERFASAMIGVWAALERSGDLETADRVSIMLARRLARDLRMQGAVDEAGFRAGKGRR
jgi:hypothetical protein